MEPDGETASLLVPIQVTHNNSKYDNIILTKFLEFVVIS